MMTAYAETYLSGAQRRLGALFEFATLGLGLDLARAHSAFLASPLSRRFAAGDPAVVAGRSGEELALEVLGAGAFGVPANRDWAASESLTMREHTPGDCDWAADKLRTGDWAPGDRAADDWTPRELRPDDWTPRETASAEYWTGWALAFYQWASGYGFGAIEKRVHIDEIRSLYTPYHEMDVRQLCDRLDELCTQAHPKTNLQARRLAAGLSQSQLARAASIPTRTLQQYEQRQKNINHARADYVDALARALGCSSADLFEHSALPKVEYAVVKL